MLETDKVFAGSIPENYDRYMVPFIFEPYAADLAQRAASLSPNAVLEIAAGTGVLTRALAPKLSPGASYIVTDLNQPMVDYAASRQPPDSRIKWRQADALALPFENAAFDLVCCQFGAMFFPDRTSGYREATRSPEARRTFSIQRMGSHRGECFCGRCDECSRKDFSERSAALSGTYAARLPRYGTDPQRTGGRRFLPCGDRDESRTKPCFLAAPSGRCLLSGNSSSQRNRGQRRRKTGSGDRLRRIRD